MTRHDHHCINPALDLVFERVVDITPAQVWAAWTQPELIVQWFTPAPWVTTSCEVDLQPGGAFRTTMRSPEGQAFPHEGCYLEIIEEQRLVWTNALAPGFRPKVGAQVGPIITAVITLAPHPHGAVYKAVAIHGSAEQCEQHKAMGFHEGWGKALDQLIDMVKRQGI